MSNTKSVAERFYQVTGKEFISKFSIFIFLYTFFPREYLSKLIYLLFDSPT